MIGKNKKSVFLFGSGASVLWNSPSTPELTELVRNSGFKTTDNKLFITEFIFQKLVANGYEEADINFETIINVIEEWIVYYSQFDGEKKTSSLMGCFFTPCFDEEIFNFSIKGGVQKHGYQLDIPKGSEYHFSKHANHNETPKQFFLQHLIAEILTNINARISKYAYHSAGHSVVDADTTESKLFVKWMKKIASKSSLRLYTLNYDRVFKILLERNDINIFEGFDCGEYIDHSTWLRANVPKISFDVSSNVHYNLHGSAFWHVEAYDKDQLPNAEIFLTGAPVLPINDDHAILQIERGKTIMLTNIVTGYQKAQKSVLTPFKQMQAAFDRDCTFADDIYILGYSLGDEHINETIKTAIRHNPTLKVTIVDPFFLKNNLDFQMAIKLFPYKPTGYMKATSISNKQHIFFDGAFILHTISFKEFLILQTDPRYIMHHPLK